MRDIQADLRQAMDAMPVADVHTHLGYGGRRQAATLADLAAYHWLHTELIRAGAPLSAAEARENPDAYVEKAAPFFAHIRNTSNHYCFAGMLRDLYGLRDRTLTPANWRAVDAAVRAHAGDPSWIAAVLDRANVRKVAVSLGDGRPDASDRYWLYEYGEGLFAPILHRPPGDGKKGPAFPADPAELAESIARGVRALAAEKGVRTFHVWIRDTWSYQPYDETEIAALMRRAHDGDALREDEENRLVSFSADRLAQAAGEHRMTIQLFHGMWRYGGPKDPPCVASFWNPDFLRGLMRYAPRHPATQFDVFLGTQIPGHEAASTARGLPNVAVSGGWWHGFTPRTLRGFFRDRLELLPHTAWNAFFSDGYMVEWIYAKLLLTKQCLSLVLAEMVDEGLLSPADAPELARKLLYENAVSIYGV